MGWVGKCLLIIILGMQIEQQILLPFILAFAAKIFPLETRPFFPSLHLLSLIIRILRYGFFYFAFMPFLLSYFVCICPWMTEDRVSWNKIWINVCAYRKPFLITLWTFYLFLYYKPLRFAGLLCLGLIAPINSLGETSEFLELSIQPNR